jgi:hypothetical protein
MRNIRRRSDLELLKYKGPTAVIGDGIRHATVGIRRATIAGTTKGDKGQRDKSNLVGSHRNSPLTDLARL